ncbi:hypothetical protein M8C21_025677 [Ambrosia artemisiifolia]|uniref:Uncharacterized protein n=1 Tax=Ambrosia artemisiifolia TaxID=4212 RepID=A0AAD5CXU2_AMBAR|nr:hypothetical protein M8C21_025677 [Ambrosia artemisiifolia]
MLSMNLLIRSKVLSSNMFTRFRPASRFFWNKSAANSSNNDIKKERAFSPDIELFLWTSGMLGSGKDVKVSLERNTVLIKAKGFETIKGTGALEGHETEFYSPDTTFKIDMEAEMWKDSADIKLSVPKLRGNKRVFNVRVNVTD